MRIVILFFLLIVALIIESFATTLPVLLSVLVVLLIYYKHTHVFIAAFFCGLFFDVVTVVPLGKTSILLVTLLFFITLYERKFETSNGVFVFCTTVICAIPFLILEGFSNVFLQALVSGVIAGILFVILRIGNHPKQLYDPNIL